jgi:hypothetical protein
MTGEMKAIALVAFFSAVAIIVDAIAARGR